MDERLIFVSIKNAVPRRHVKERRTAARMKKTIPLRSQHLSLLSPRTTNRKVAIPVPKSMQWDAFVTEVCERESVGFGVAS